MSVTLIGRVMWTPFEDLKAIRKNGKNYMIKASTIKGVLIAMADNADDFGEHSWNSIPTLALKTSLHVRSLPRILRALEQNGYCTYKGLSPYGTSDYSIMLEKLGFPPKNRSKVGRPLGTKPLTRSAETPDSERETPDSERETPDSERETPDSEREKTRSESSESSSESSINRPQSSSSAENNVQTSFFEIKKEGDDEFGKFCERYQNNIQLLTPAIADYIQDDWDHFPHAWMFDALELAILNHARGYGYLQACLENRKKNGGNRKVPFSKSEVKKSSTPAPTQLSEDELKKLRAKAEKEMVG
jgi:hypothetical protein